MKKLVHTEDFIKTPWRKKLFLLIQPIADKVLGFNALNKVYTEVSGQKKHNTKSFCAATLELLGAQYTADAKTIELLKSKSPLIILANHPYGSMDSLAVMHLACEHYSKEWKLTANQLLKNVEEVADHIVYVSPFAKGEEKRENLKAVRVMHETLKSGDALMMFPAARVSGWDDNLGAVRDLPWTPHPLRLSEQHNAPILLLHLTGKNSKTFLSIDPKYLMRRSIRLCKEVLLQKDQRIKISFSALMTPEQSAKISKYSNKAEVLQAHGYLGADRTAAKPTVVSASEQNSHSDEAQQTIAPFHEALSASQKCLISGGGFSSFCFQGQQEPAIMQEIGRLREQTFKYIGAGSGKEIDLSVEDEYYHHIVVTEESSGKIAGAYRVGFTQNIIAEQGESGLYLNHIFKIDSTFYSQVKNALELSRSFIPVDYQKNPKVLDMLWKSLGKTAIQNNCDGMYGSVTISADFTPLSQSILVDTLDRYHAADDHLRQSVSNDSPFIAQTTYHKMVSDAYAPHGIGALNPIIEDLEEGIRPIPPLIRYYSTVGAKFLSFKVEPSFNNAIYCLLHVDLHQLPERYKKRFLR